MSFDPLTRAMRDHRETLMPRPQDDMVAFMARVVRFLARFDDETKLIDVGYGMIGPNTPIDLPEGVRWNGQRAWPADQAADVFELWPFVEVCRKYGQ
ncbi:MAG: hypothetical protein EBV64_11805 [Oxalobacteraceae bacterium]|nr:hypothetical protein [Oxalobacteraceae bacterium]